MNRFLRLQATAFLAVFCGACGSSSKEGGSPQDSGGCPACSDGGEGEGGNHRRDGSSGTDGSTPVESGADGGIPSGDGSVLTYHNDNARTGQNTNETVLMPSNVNSKAFGKKFKQSVDSYIYAQPLFFPGLTVGGNTHNVVFVATEANSVYAFDADAAGPVLWHVNVGTARSCSVINDCEDLVPGAGITGTPVIDPSTQTMYLVSLVVDSSGTHHRLHALDITTGGEKFGGPVEISPHVPGTGANSQGGEVEFDPSTHYQRCALLLTGGVVYIGIGSDAETDSDNHGWIVAYKANDLSSTMTFCTSPNDNWSSIWQTGGGLSADSDGYIYAETANGTFDVNTGGSDWGDSALKLDANGKVVDYFTPYNQADLSSGDIDFGSANPVLLPDQSGPVAHELLASGKPGILYLINRDNMGHYSGGSSDSQIVQSVSAFPNTSSNMSGIFMSPAYWNGNVYVAGIGDNLAAYSLSAGLLSTSPTSQSPETFSWPGGAQVSVSSNGTSAGIVWALDGNEGVLYAYDATNLANELYNTTQASGSRDALGAPVKYAVPTVANGHVYVGTQTEIDVYGGL
jgi:hypothetical protein